MDMPVAPWTYERLLACEGAGSDEDRHIFACVLAQGCRDTDRTITQALGLTLSDLGNLLEHFFPAAAPHLTAGLLNDSAELAFEEGDLRELLLTHRAAGKPEEAWLTRIIARRSLQPNHLWEDLGLQTRSDLTALMARHFPELAAKNGGMRWKKFFYRQLCEAEGISICKSPICSTCSDYAACFLTES